MNKRIVVAMSGGVDSSVAAVLLKKQGYEVIGMTMCFNLSDSPTKKPVCCGIGAIEDARRVCHKLGIKHYVVNMQKELEKRVIRDFLREYSSGRTPNPCVRCNQYLKFDALLKKALFLDAQYLATGHYARITRAQGFLLKKAKDKKKDQSYFLYRLNQVQLEHILFPLGNYTKEEVRKIAKKSGLPVADKLASQEICFLPGADYRGFLRQRLRRGIKPGQVTDKEGNILGRHKGVAFYTIGQREGLGIARGYPLYITKIDYQGNKITVGSKEDALKKEFLLKEPHFVFAALKKEVAARVKIRYNHKEMPARIIPLSRQIKVCFKKPQFAITPGQSAVFYDKDIVLGGGIIDRVLG
ncbi:MAG: tRNA 2-thiouridine(34) synthase MnmA [Candidatus Omnitrophota bacterium]|jgi:tRNA-specific 2-thiouridylase